MNLVKGKLSAHAKGFAFVTPEEFGQDDIFIPPNELGTAMNGDTVMVRVSHKSNGTKKKERSSVFWSVILRRLSVPIQKRKALVLSFLMIKITNDIFIPKSAKNGAVEGHKVVVTLTSYPEGRMSAEGEVTEILGHKMTLASIFYRLFINTVYQVSFRKKRSSRQ